MKTRFFIYCLVVVAVLASACSPAVTPAPTVPAAPAAPAAPAPLAVAPKTDTSPNYSAPRPTSAPLPTRAVPQEWDKPGAPSPFAQREGAYILRFGVKGYEIPDSQRKPLALTFVIDISGSMNMDNRLGLVKRSLELLVNRLKADDTVSIVVFGSDARLQLPIRERHR